MKVQHRMVCAGMAFFISQSVLLPTAHAADAAGRIVRDLEVRPLAPPKPTPEIPNTLSPIKDSAASDEGAAIINISSFSFSGNTAFDDATLAAVVSDLLESPITLQQLKQGANQVTQFYRNNGWLLARAVLPAQEIADGKVSIQIVEGHYDAVVINNSSRVSNTVVNRAMRNVKTGDGIINSHLENALMQADALPGAQVQASLSAGQKSGTSSLDAQVMKTPLVSGNVVLDNYGNTYNGAYRLGGGIMLSSPAGIGDQLSLQALVSNEGQLWVRGEYDLPVGPWNTRIGTSASWLSYELGKEFEALDAKGDASSASIFASQNWWTQRSWSINSKIEIQHRNLNDEQLGLVSEKSLTSLMITPLSGYWRDNVLGGGANSYQLVWTTGDLSLDSNYAKASDFLDTEGSYNKLSVAFLRQQTITSQMYLQLNLRGQLADSNLDSVEKISLGGAYGVRAYPQGEANGDEGWLANLELRRFINKQWQVGAFVDAGRVSLNKKPLPGLNDHRSLSGAGLAGYWQPSNDWQVTASATMPLGSEKPVSDKEKDVYLWAQLQYLF